jgi:hypothetical protein
MGLLDEIFGVGNPAGLVIFNAHSFDGGKLPMKKALQLSL